MNLRFLCRTALCGLALLLAKPLVQACGPMLNEYEYIPNFFDTDVAGRQNSGFTQFSYSSQGWFRTMADEENTSETEDDFDGNRAEWSAYTGGLPLGDVDSFVYRYPYASLSALYYNLERNTPAGSVETHEANAMTQWFRRTTDLEALGYLMWAKKTEVFLEEQDWEAPKSTDTAQTQNLIKGSKALLSKAQNPFIKQRYAYQILKLLFYSHRYAKLLQQYPALSKDATGNIATRMQSLEAGAYYHTNQFPKAAYLFSRVFSAGPEWQHSASISYGWSSGWKTSPAIMALCKNAHERAVIHLLNGLHLKEKALSHLEAIAAEDPNLAGTEALFTREISKVEEKYLAYKVAHFFVAYASFAAPYWDYYDFDYTVPKPAAGSANYLSRLTSFGLAQAARVVPAQRGYWHLAVAYLYFIQNNLASLEAQLALAEKAPLTPVETGQLGTLRLLQIANLDAPLTEAAEAEMLPYLKALDARRQVSGMARVVYTDFVGGYLAGKYLTQGDSVKALFAMARTEMSWYGNEPPKWSTDKQGFMDNAGILLQHLSPRDFAAVKAFPAAGKSAYEKWLGGTNPYPAESIYELEGTRHMRDHNFAEAVKWYAKVPPKIMEQRLFPDPFSFDAGGGLNDEVKDTATALNRYTFAQKMARLQARTDAAGRFEYGLGLWGMGYFGKAHRAYDYFWHSGYVLGQVELQNKGPLSPHEREYFGAFAAEKVFVQIAATTINKELKAKALFMASKCWQQRVPVEKVKKVYDTYTYFVYKYDYAGHSLKSPHFKTLKEELAGTPAYENLRRQCSYFDDYVKSK